MIEIAKRAHIHCDICNAEIVFDKEDIQTNEDSKTEYGSNSWDTTRYYKITTYFITCPVCGTKYNLKTTKEETSSHW